MNEISAFEYLSELLKPRKEIEKNIAHLIASTVDIELGCGPILDILGDLEGEPRKGLTDAEYRKIIRARRVAKFGAKSIPGIWTGWEILIGPDPVAINWYHLAPATILLTAETDYLPTELFIKRAGKVVGDFIPAGYEISAWIAQPGALQYNDDVLVWDENYWAYSLETKQP